MTSFDTLIGRLEALLNRIEPLLPPPVVTIDWHTTLACRWRHCGNRGRLEPVVGTSSVRLQDLLCIETQKSQIVRNTRQFLNGLPSNNVLLWGPRGTGKSSLIKALLNEFAAQALRLIEVDRQDLHGLPDLAAQLRGLPERFIVYCDDLSFEHDDTSYKTLKVVLDGSISNATDNMLFYATSNRRHLLPERLSDNLESHLEGGELHHGETVEEQLSLSERFGIWLSFHPFTQEDYLHIVHHWVRQFGLTVDTDDSEMRLAALQWALLHGSRSGRSAWQFANDWVGQKRLDERTR